MKYTPGLLVGQLSKSAGSTTAGHNRNGSYLRTRTIPTNPNTAKQTTVRADFTALAQQFKGLSAANIAGWIALGATMVRSDSLGNSYSLTGLQAYESVNRTLKTLGNAQVSTPPTLTSPAALLTVILTATSV